MAVKLEFHFSHTFQGAVWNMILVPGKSVLILEIRNDERRQVSFSAWDYVNNQFLWKELQINESWWVNLYQADEKTVVLSKFENTNNPDSISYISLDIQTGAVIEYNHVEPFPSNVPDGEILIPIQYVPDTPYFETVKKFIRQKVNETPLHSMEYLENAGLIFISIYTQNGSDLENLLLVFDEDGKLVLRQKIGAAVKGLGLETFFIKGEYLFFVKSKVELVTYRLIKN